MELDKSVNKPQGPKTLKPQNAMNTSVNNIYTYVCECISLCMVSMNMLDYLSQCDDLNEFAAVSF